MTSTRGFLALVSLLGLVAGTPVPAWATWSIVAVDPRTREVGAAGASCTSFVAGIVGLAPGRGVIVVQAASNPLARMRGVELLNQGADPASIVRALRDPSFDPQDQQYGVVALDVDSGATWTGADAYAEAATAHGRGVTVQGNTLPSREVVHAAMAAYRAAADAGAPLAERLLRALEAGSAAGGDRRCSPQTAYSAFLAVARPGDEPRQPYVRLIIPDQSETGINPVLLLRRAYDRQRGGQTSSLRRHPAPAGTAVAVVARRGGREVTPNGSVHSVEATTTRTAPGASAGRGPSACATGITRGETDA